MVSCSRPLSFSQPRTTPMLSSICFSAGLFQPKFRLRSADCLVLGRQMGVNVRPRGIHPYEEWLVVFFSLVHECNSGRADHLVEGGHVVFDVSDWVRRQRAL